MSEKRYKIDYSDKIVDKESNQKYYFEDMEDWRKIVNLLNEQDHEIKHLEKLADANEEQALNIMSYLHDNHYEIWEKVNQKCFGDIE